MTLLAVAWIVTPRDGLAFSKGAYGGFSGAPGEETCRHCHDTFPLNLPLGSLTVEGFPETYVPGETYRVRVTLSSDSGLRWGFQGTVLNTKHRPAGKLIAFDREHTKVVPGIFFTNRRYVEQKRAGSYEEQRGGATWEFDWRAPKRNKGPLTLYVAGNVANDNDAKTGDFIFATQKTAEPAQ